MRAKWHAVAEPKFFNFEWEFFSTEIAGVTVEANLFNVAPCAVLVNARGVKVCMSAIPCMQRRAPHLLHGNLMCTLQ